MELAFSDEFDRATFLDGARNTWATTFFWGGRSLPTNKEEQLYMDPNYRSPGGNRPAINPFSIEGGVLTIRAQPTPTELLDALMGYKYTSGLITTHIGFPFRYGCVEVRAKVPRGRGLWPAVWLLRRDKGALGEIDIVEILGDRPDFMNSTVHSRTKLDGPLSTMKLVRTKVVDLSADFHTYAVDWNEGSIAVYLDGAEMGRVETPEPLKSAMYLLIGLAVGGKWAGSPDAATHWPADFKLDWVRIWQDRGAARP